MSRVPTAKAKLLPPAELADQQPLAKRCFSACGQPEFREHLKESGRNQVLVAGIETHICVYQTTRDLRNDGYEVEVVADAVSSRTAINKEIGLEKMRLTGTGITSVETALFELLGEAGTPAFKEISRLVK